MYYPPTPSWVSVAAVSLGLLTFVGGVFFARVVPSYFDPEELAVRYAMCGFFYALAVLGFGFLCKGMRRWLYPPKLNPAPLAEDSQIYYEGEPRG